MFDTYAEIFESAPDYHYGHAAIAPRSRRRVPGGARSHPRGPAQGSSATCLRGAGISRIICGPKWIISPWTRRRISSSNGPRPLQRLLAEITKVPLADRRRIMSLASPDCTMSRACPTYLVRYAGCSGQEVVWCSRTWPWTRLRRASSTASSRRIARLGGMRAAFSTSGLLQRLKLRASKSPTIGLLDLPWAFDSFEEAGEVPPSLWNHRARRSRKPPMRWSGRSDSIWRTDGLGCAGRCGALPTLSKPTLLRG